MTPDWPPRASARDYSEGTRKHGSTGQVWEVRNGAWVRIIDAYDYTGTVESSLEPGAFED
jgi:hypothetical protein